MRRCDVVSAFQQGMCCWCQNIPFYEKFESRRDLERFARRHHDVLTESLWIELKRPSSDSAFRYFSLQVDITAVCAAIRDWMIAQIPCGADDLDQLIFDGKTLRGSIEPIIGGGSAFIAQVTLYSAALGVAIAQTCYAIGQDHGRAVLQKLLGKLDLDGIPIQAEELHRQQVFFGSSRSRGPTYSLRSSPTRKLSTGRSPAGWLESAVRLG